ncbi:hypothetical protein AB0K18_29750 [Nonomuraea sp. NPDC049421]|uniref:hypothetical protein n=1 Tax=Nonomuraea sp. NPDC049421 TaxID=3155275 RepID=UPI00342FFAF1
MFDDKGDGTAHIAELVTKSHTVRSVIPPKPRAAENEPLRDEPEVIHTSATSSRHRRDTARAPVSVAIAHTAVDILHHQPELPGSARAHTRTRPAPVGRRGPRLTTRAEVSSDDLAVTRHALTAVAEVKVRA